MILWKNRKEKIERSKEIIEQEKQKIKEEKIKMKQEKKQKKQSIFKKIFTKKQNIEKLTIKEQIFSMIYFEILGFIFCLLLLFILSGGKNYIKLYLELNKLINVYDTVTSNYYGEIDKETMIDDAIDSMMKEAGDSYTTYTNKKETREFFENIDSTYEGIGYTVATNHNKEIYVVSIFDNSPAKEAGIKENDIILKIDEKDFKGKNSEDMANYIKNSNKTKIKLLIKRNEEELNITINRKKVEIPTVSGEVINQADKKIGYIQISIFSAVTYDQFKTKLQELEKEKIQGLIIDVRNNTGGYLSSVTDIASIFLKKGDVIYKLEEADKIEKIKDKTRESRNYPIAVLMNAASASASEILAAAMKESYHGIVVGTYSYGKGTVQKTKKLSDGSMIKYTIQKWLTPDGNWINEKGLEPTEFVELKSVDDMDNQTNSDNQLNKALELINKKIK